MSNTIDNEKEMTVENFESTVIGVVSNCDRLNVRTEPSVDATIVCEITKATEVEIDTEKSTDDFYKISTASGIDGYCMRKYITDKQ